MKGMCGFACCELNRLEKMWGLSDWDDLSLLCLQVRYGEMAFDILRNP